MAKKKVLICTPAVGYSPAVPHLFLESLKATGYEGDMIICDGPSIQYQKNYLPHCYKLWEFRATMKTIPKKFDTVIMTDFRDVLFQKNPEEIEHGYLDVFLEDGRYTIGDEPHNKHWVERDYPECPDLLEKPISCAGVVIGTHDGMLEYFDRVIRQIELRELVEHSPEASAHHYLVWKDGFTERRVVANEDPEGAVYTVGLCDQIALSRGKIIRPSGTVPAIVHQYDRHIP